MIELTTKDSDKILNYLRGHLSDLNEQKYMIEDTKKSYLKKDNPIIEKFNELFIDDEHRADFDEFNKRKFETDLECLNNKMHEVENCILLLTVGSEA